MAFFNNAINFPNLTSKGTPVGADLILIADSAASNALKQATVSSIQSAGGSGALTKIASVTASTSATVNFDNNLSSTYDNYLVMFSGVQNATDATWMKAKFGTGGTPTYQATNYAGNCHGFDGTTNFYFANSGTTAIDMTYNNAGFPALENTNQSLNGHSFIHNANGSTYKGLVTQHGYINSLTGNTSEGGSGALWKDATVITSIQFLMNGGNINAGIFKLYGITN